MAMLINLFPKHNWRLRHHLQAPSGNITDPNGLSQFKGVYHIFHQYEPRWPRENARDTSAAAACFAWLATNFSYHFGSPTVSGSASRTKSEI